MCEPISATIAVTAGVLKVASALADHAAQNRQHDAVHDAAEASLKLQDNELSLREVQDRIAGGQQIDQADRAVAATQGDERTSAAARGVGGISVDMLLNDADRQGAAYRQSVNDNTDAEAAQLERNKEQARAEATARENGAPGASWLNTGLKIGGAALEAYGAVKGQQPKTTT